LLSRVSRDAHQCQTEAQKTAGEIHPTHASHEAILIAVYLSPNDNFPMMSVKRAAAFVLVCAALAAGAAGDTAGILVDVYGKLLLIRSDGTQQALSDSAISAALSQDGKMLAFTRNEDLAVVPISGGAAKQITKLPRGAHFGSLQWLPDGSAILYEGQGGHLYIAFLSGNPPSPRDLGPWYQGFSISSDGSEVVHADAHSQNIKSGLGRQDLTGR
jgi:WD40 repeat protein